jgi:hypothetical protein
MDVSNLLSSESPATSIPPESEWLYPNIPNIPSSPTPGSPTSTEQESSQHDTSRDTRIKIQTALLFKVPHKDICEALEVAKHQIIWARNHRITPQKKRSGGYSKLKTLQKNNLQSWIQ